MAQRWNTDSVVQEVGPCHRAQGHTSLNDLSRLEQDLNRQHHRPNHEARPGRPEQESPPGEADPPAGHKPPASEGQPAPAQMVIRIDKLRVAPKAKRRETITRGGTARMEEECLLPDDGCPVARAPDPAVGQRSANAAEKTWARNIATMGPMITPATSTSFSRSQPS